MTTQCVLRQVQPGDHQYVPVTEVLRRAGKLVPGENVYLGAFKGRSEKCGPYDSDRRMICFPVGKLEIVKATSDGRVVLN